MGFRTIVTAKLLLFAQKMQKKNMLYNIFSEQTS